MPVEIFLGRSIGQSEYLRKNLKMPPAIVFAIYKFQKIPKSQGANALETPMRKPMWLNIYVQFYKLYNL